MLNFGGPIHISGMAEARAVKLCTQVGLIKSCQKNEKSPQKGRGYGHMTYLNS